MKNKNVGVLITGIAILMGIIILIFNQALAGILDQTCSHGSACTMHETLKSQTNLSFAVAGIVLLIGLFLIFSKEQERIIIKRVTKRVPQKRMDLSKLDKDEKQVIKILQEESGAIFQSSLAEKLGVGKVKMTRLMDKLEAKQLVERKRRGMNNIIVLKYR